MNYPDTMNHPVTDRQRKLIAILKEQLAMDDDTFIAFMDDECPDATMVASEPATRRMASDAITALQREREIRRAGAV